MKKLNDWIYVYYIKDDYLFYDRTFSRFGLGPDSAKRAVDTNESRGYESFYVIGTTVSTRALNEIGAEKDIKERAFMADLVDGLDENY